MFARTVLIRRSPPSWPVALIVVAAVLVAAPAAPAAIGDLVQKPGAEGCVAAPVPAVPGCGAGRLLVGANDLALSPDGKQAYVAAVGSYPSDPGGVAIFDRDPATGVLTQRAGAAGCMTDSGSAGACQDATALQYPSFVTVSHDGRNVYVVAGGSEESSIAIFDRDTATGDLTQKPGTAGCVSDDGNGGLCADGREMLAPRRVALTSDGTSAYVGSAATYGGVVVFDRDPGTGALTQKAGTAGCLTVFGSGGECTQARTDSAIQVATSPDAKNVYVVSVYWGVAVFDRNVADGVLTQKPGTAGCMSDNGWGGTCADGRAMGVSEALTVSADGTNAYLAAGGALVVLDRDPVDGRLTQKPGAAGCIAADTTEGCAVWRGVRTAADVVVSGDGHSAYTAAWDGIGSSDGIGIFDRHPLTGALTQKAGADGCVTHDGSAGQCDTGVGLAKMRRVVLSGDDADVYSVAAIGMTGNAGGSIASFDREGGELPDTAIVAGPADGATVVGAATFEFVSSAAGSTFACTIDGAAAVACASPFTTPALGAGAHTFSVLAIDPRGNADPTPASRSFHAVAPPPPPPPAAAAPVNVAAPTIEGRATVGRRVSCARGRWTGSEPIAYAVRWLRNGRVVGSGTRYRIAAADGSKRLRCRVLASNAAGRAAATSAAVRARTDVLLIRATGALRPPAGARRSAWCRGTIALTLLKGRQVVGRRTVRLNGKCRWSWTFRVSRARIGTAKRLRLRQRFSGNDYLNPGVAVRWISVSRA